MAKSYQTQVILTSVIKGYHVYKCKIAEDKTYMCVKDHANCVDKEAVLVRCIEDNKSIGHVPAVPVPLNKAFLKII